MRLKQMVQLADGSLGLAGAGTLSVYGFTFSVGAEAADAIIITCQLTDGMGNPLKIAGIAVHVQTSVAAAAAGDYTQGTALTTLAVTSGYLIVAQSANRSLLVATDTSGQIVLTATIAGATSRRFTLTPFGGMSLPSQTALISWAA